jgi:hypothetical protein
MNELHIVGLLAETGLVYLGMADPTAPLIPPTLATFATSCPPDEGRIAATVYSDDPQLRRKANAAWFELSRTGGLFGSAPSEFLLAINRANDDQPAIWRWARVELADSWDVMGVGAAGILGNGVCRPEFVMLSVDGMVIVRGTTWESSIGAILVRDPHRIRVLRDHAKWMAGRPRTSEADRDAIEQWLNTGHDHQ